MKKKSADERGLDKKKKKQEKKKEEEKVIIKEIRERKKEDISTRQAIDSSESHEIRLIKEEAPVLEAIEDAPIARNFSRGFNVWGE